MLEDDLAIVRRAVLDRVGLGLPDVVAGGQAVAADAEIQVGAGGLLDLRLDFGPLIEGIAQQPFFIGLQIEDAGIAAEDARRHRR